MLTANEIRSKQTTTRDSRVQSILTENRANAAVFANDVINKELANISHFNSSLTWYFEIQPYHQALFGNTIAANKSVSPVHYVTVATKARRLENIFGYRTVDLDALKEYIEQHGYHVTVESVILIEESWSRKSKYRRPGFKLTISWEE